MATALVVTGCGKSSKSEATTTSAGTTSSATQTTTAPTTSNVTTDLVSEANEICKRLAARRASTRAQTQLQAVKVATELAAFEQGIVVEMRKFVPPAAMASDWKQLLAHAQTLATDTAKISELAQSTGLETPAFAALVAKRRVVESEAAAIAKHAGLQECTRAI
ncbi:MAG: hypothetical protein WAN93_10015 [Solirubrobacteraceae bacterium]